MKNDDPYLEDLKEGWVFDKVKHATKYYGKAAINAAPAAAYAAGKTAQTVGKKVGNPIVKAGASVAKAAGRGVASVAKSAGQGMANSIKNRWSKYMKDRKSNKNIRNLHKNITRNKALAKSNANNVHKIK